MTSWRGAPSKKCVFFAAAVLSLLITFYIKKTFFTRVYPADDSYVVCPLRVPIQGRIPAILPVEQRMRINLFVGIYSAPQHVNRRNAIRQTWGSQCKTAKDVVCWFITDGIDVEGGLLKGKVKARLDNESRLYNDIVYAGSPGGVNFARRYLWTIQWASERYKFNYLLRVDDDYFVCFQKLLLELPYRPKRNLAWGWLSCTKDIVCLDEGLVLITGDVIISILNRANSTLLCHPYGGQALAMWLKDVPDLQIFGDNKRIFHREYPLDASDKTQEVCRTALGIHQSYPKQMKLYWSIYLKERNKEYPVPPIEFPCDHPPIYDYKVFGDDFYAVPKLCKNFPTWNRGKYYKGREGEQK